MSVLQRSMQHATTQLNICGTSLFWRRGYSCERKLPERSNKASTTALRCATASSRQAASRARTSREASCGEAEVHLEREKECEESDDPTHTLHTPARSPNVNPYRDVIVDGRGQQEQRKDQNGLGIVVRVRV